MQFGIALWTLTSYGRSEGTNLPYPSRMMRLLLLSILTLFAPSACHTQHTTALYRASRVGPSQGVKRASVSASEDITIIDLADADEDDATPGLLHIPLLAAPGAERRWAWPALR